METSDDSSGMYWDLCYVPELYPRYDTCYGHKQKRYEMERFMAFLLHPFDSRTSICYFNDHEYHAAAFRSNQCTLAESGLDHFSAAFLAKRNVGKDYDHRDQYLDWYSLYNASDYRYFTKYTVITL